MRKPRYPIGPILQHSITPLLRRCFFRPWLAPILVALCLLPGCGYQLRADGQPVGIQIESLAIPLVKSTSSELGFEAHFTKILREEFISHARVPLVSENEAQAVLKGRIWEVRAEPLTYDYQEWNVQGRTTAYEVTDSRRLKVKLDIQLVERGSGKVVWHEKAMEDKASYEVGTDPLRNRYNQQQALEKIARRLAKKVYLMTLERF